MRLFLLTLLATLNLVVVSATENPTNPIGQGISSPSPIVQNNMRNLAFAKVQGKDVVSIPMDKEATYEYSSDNFKTISGMLSTDSKKMLHIPFTKQTKEKVSFRERGSTEFTATLFNVRNANRNNAVAFTALLTQNPASMCSGSTVTFTGVVVGGTPGASYTYQLFEDTGFSSVQLSSATTATSFAFTPITLTNATSTDVSLPYHVEISDGSTMGTDYRTVTVRPLPIPTVTAATSPICNGVAFAASASVTVSPGVTWKQVTTPNGTGLPATGVYGASNNTISGTATNVTGADLTGTYDFYVKYAIGTACEQFASNSLTVQSPPVISVDPTAQTVCFDSPATFDVTATGSGTVNYQWKKNGSTNVGTDAASYTTPNTVHADNGNIYSVVLTNVCTSVSPNTPVTSGNASLTVNAKAIAVSAGADVTVCTTPSITAVSIAADVTMSDASTWTTGTWSSSGSGTFGSTTAASTTYTPDAADRGTDVTLTWTVSDPDGSGPCVGGQTDSKVIKVLNAPEGMPSAATQTICNGEANTVTLTATTVGTLFKVTAAVTGGSPSGQTTPQANLADGAALDAALISNASSSTTAELTYTVTPYNVGINGIDDNGAGDDCLGTPFDVVITVQAAMTANAGLTQTPASVCSGSTATYTLTGLPSGLGDLEILYTLPNGNFYTVTVTPSGTSASFTTTDPFVDADNTNPVEIFVIKNLATGCEYYPPLPIVGNVNLNLVSSPAIVGTIPARACTGYVIGTDLTGTAPTSASGTLSYRWVRSSTDIFTGATATPALGTNMTATVGATTLAPTLSALAAGASYFVTLRAASTSPGSVCYSYATPQQIDMKTDITAPVVSTSALNICEGGNATLSVAAVPNTAGGGSATYVWQSSTDAAFTSPVDVSTGLDVYNPTALPTGALTDDMWYRVSITDAAPGCTSPVVSAAGTKVNVNKITTAGTIDMTSLTLTSGAVCSDVDPGLTFNPTTLTVGAGNDVEDATPTYRWERSTDNFATPGLNVSTTANYNPVAINNVTSSPITYTFKRFVISTVGTSVCEKESNAVSYDVNPEPVIMAAATETAICSDATPALTFDLTTKFPSTGGSVAATAYNWSATSVTALTNENVPASATGVTALTLTNPIRNTSGSTANALYSVTPISAAGCLGNAVPAAITQPVTSAPLVANQTATICSDAPSALTLGASSNAIAVDHYEITNVVASVVATFSVTPAGGGATLGAQTTSVTDSGLADDAWKNQGLTNANRTVTYTIFPVSVDGCKGPSFTVTLTIRPEPGILGEVLTVCSDVVIPNAATMTFGPTITNYASLTGATYNIVDIVNPASLTHNAGTATVNTGQAVNALIGEGWNNVTSAPATITYKVAPVTSVGCVGDTVDFVLTVNPEPLPKMTIAPATTCSGVATDYDLQAQIDNLTTDVLFTYSAPTNTGGMTGGTARTVAAAGNITDTFVNTTGVDQTATYTVTPYYDATTDCAGTPFDVTITVSPAPTATAPANVTVCNNTAATVTVPGNVISMFGGAGLEVTYTTSVTGAATFTTALTQVGTTADGTFTTTHLFTDAEDDATITITQIKHVPSDCTISPNFDITVDVNKVVAGTATSTLPLSACEGYDPANAEITLSGSTGDQTLNYEWEESSDGTTYGTAGGVDTDGLTTTGDDFDLSSLSAGHMRYRCRVYSGAIGDPTTCSTVTNVLDITVNPQLAIPAITPDTSVVCPNTSVNLSTPSVTGTGTIAYAWEYSADDAFTAPTAAGNTNTQASINVTDDTWYRVSISDSGAGCNTVVSAPAVIVVNNVDAGSLLISTATECSDISFDIDGTSGVANADSFDPGSGPVNGTAPTYAWSVSTPTPTATAFGTGDSYMNANGINNITNAPVSYTYTRTATSTLTVATVSATCTADATTSIDINPEPVSSPMVDITICSDLQLGTMLPASTATSVATTTFDVSINNPDPSNIYDGIFNTVPSGGSGTYTVGSDLLEDDSYNNLSGIPQIITYHLVPKSADGCAGTPVTFNATIKPEPTLSTATTTPICPGSDVTVTMTGNNAAMLAAGLKVDYIIDYPVASSNADVTITNATVTATTGTDGQFVVAGPFGNNEDGSIITITKITNTAVDGCSITLGVDVTVDVNQVSAGTVASTLPPVVCSGYDPVANTAISATGTIAENNPSYEWQELLPGADPMTGWGTASGTGADMPSGLDLAELTSIGVTKYRLRARSTDGLLICDDHSTPTVDITVKPDVSPLTITPDITVICPDASVTLSSSAIVAGEGISPVYNWEESDDDGNSVPYAAAAGTANTATYTTPMLTQDKYYRLVITDDAALGCDNAISAVAPVVVNNVYAGDILPSLSPVCSDVTFTVDNSIPAGEDGFDAFAGFAPTYSWTVTPTPTPNTALGTNDSTPSLSINNVSGAPISYIYKRTASSELIVGTGVSATCTADITTEVIVNPEPVATAADVTVCSNNTATIALSSNTAGATDFSWTHDNPATLTNITPTTGTTTSAITVTPINKTGADVTINYTITPTSADGCVGSDIMKSVTVHSEPVGVKSLTQVCSDISFDIDPQANINAQAAGSGITVYTANSAAPLWGNSMAGTTFSWQATTVPVFVSGVTTSGTGHIIQTLTNSAITVQTVIYTVTPTSIDGCAGTPFTVTVKVNGVPLIGSTANGDADLCVNEGRTVSATVLGGVAPYVYTWTATHSGGAAGSFNSTTVQAPTYTPSAAGSVTLSVSVMDAKGCTATAAPDLVFAINPVPAVTLTPTHVDCYGASNGKILATGSLGTSPYEYKLQLGAYNAGTPNYTFMGISPGTYTVTVKDLNSCTATADVTITQPSAPVTAPVSAQVNVLCHGLSTGSVTLTPAGGTAPYTLSAALAATPGTPAGTVTGNTVSALAAGTYNISVTDSKGCVLSVPITITEPSVLGLQVASKTDVLCNGQTNGTATLSATGGVAPYTFTSSSTSATHASASSPLFGNLAAGTYSFTVTDNNLCTSVAMVTITEPSAITVTQTVTNVSCYGGNNGQITVVGSGGTGTFDYKIGTGLYSPAGTFSSLTAGVYTVSSRDFNGCIVAKDITVTEPTDVTLTTSQVNVACKGGSTGTATVSATGGVSPYTYAWSTGGTTTTISGLAIGTYSVTVTDDHACTKVTSVTITEPTNVVTASVTAVTNVDCKGNSTGSATVAGAGGNGSFTYSWGVGTTPTAAANSGLAAGVYIVTVADVSLCSTTVTVTITEPTNPLSAMTTVTDVSCKGDATGIAVVSGAGGTVGAGYTYLWNNTAASTTATITGLLAGTYTVTVTDANACTTTATAIVGEPALVLSAVTTVTDVSCNGDATGTATAVPTGGNTASYTYSWSNGQTVATATGLLIGTYTVTVTDAKGCTTTATATVGEPTVLSAVTTVTDVSCNGGNNGTATATPTGGNGGYTYKWSNVAASTTATATGLIAGTYTVTVTDAKGCTTTSTTVAITEPSAITLTSTQTAPLCNGQANGSITVTATGGTGAYTLTSPSGTVSGMSVSGLTAGTYILTVTDANLCPKTISVTVTQPAVLALAPSKSNVTCNGGANGTITLSPSGGTSPYSYNWNPNNSGSSISGSTLIGLTAGAKQVTVTDANGCTVTTAQTITQPSVITVTTANTTITNVSCYGGTNGSVALKATGGSTTTYSYNWGTATLPASGYSNLAQTRTGLAAGVYIVTVTNAVTISGAAGCPVTITATVTQPTDITVATAQTDILCKGAATGAITVTSTGGTGTHTYKWSDGPATTADRTGLLAGVYTVTVTDANLCPKTSTVTITEPATAVSATTTVVDILCKGDATGSATVIPAGGTVGAGYTYLWSDIAASTTATASGLVAGTYHVTVTDGNGCSTTATATVIEPVVALSTTTTVTDVLCKGAATGSATAIPAGGTVGAGYTYLWSDVAASTTATASGLLAGTYSVTVTDGNGCSTTATATVTEPAMTVSATTTVTDVLCKGAATGTATAIPAGGTVGTGYTYLWSDVAASTTATASGLIAGTYMVTVTDGNGCSTTATATITEPATIVSATTTVTDVKCKSAATGTATAIPAGGTVGTGYTYLWSDIAASTTATASGLIAGTYTVTVTDGNGCSTTATATIAEPAAALAATTAQTNVLCFGQANGKVTVTATGGTAPYTLASSGGTVSAMNVNGLAMGTYTITVTDANLCTTTVSVTITQPVVLAVTLASKTNVTCNGGTNGTVTLNPTGGTLPYTYTWSPNNTGSIATGNVISGLSAGAKTITLTDANGCFATVSSGTITQPSAITVVSPVITHVKCFGATTGAASFKASGGSSTSYSYNWGAGVGNTPTAGPTSTTVTNTGLAAGVYPVTITNGVGCSNVVTMTITQPAAALAATTAQTNVLCFGEANGKVTVTATGGTSPYTLASSGGTVSAMNVNGLAIGTYTITVTDANLCSTNVSVTITQPSAPLSATFTQVDVLCHGEATGSVAITPAGGTAPYSIAPAQTGLVAGAYTFTVTDANLCTTTVSATITQPTAPLTATISQTNVTCFGAGNGSVTITPAGGTGAYTIAPSTTTNLIPGAYSFTVTDANLCTTTVSATITEPAAALTATLTQTNATCRGGSTGTVTVTPTGGTAPYSIAPAQTGLAAGTYSFTVTDVNLCTTTVDATITEPAAVDVTKTICSRIATAITLNNAAATTYNITAINMNGLTVSAGSPATGTGLSASEIADDAYINNTSAPVDVIYTIEPVSADGCVGLPDMVTVTVNPEPGSPTLTTIQRCSATPYTIDATNLANNLAGTTFTWTASTTSNPAFINPGLVTSGSNQAAISGNYSNLSTGDVVINYAITATSAQGCAAPAFNIEVTLNGQPNVTIASLGGNKVCKDAPRDLLAVTIGGGSPYTYVWGTTFASGGAGALNSSTLESPTFTGTAPGKATFNVTVTDNNGCVVASAPYNLTINDTPTFSSVSVTNVACFGASNGQIIATGAGGTGTYQYQLNVNPFQGSGTFTNLSPGTYTVVVKDGNSCTSSDTKTVTQPTAPLTSTISSQTNVSCNNGNDGSVTLNATGGTSPYTYNAGAGTVSGNVISGLSANTYNVTITDANSCTYTIPVNISQPSALNLIVATQANATCNGLSNGSVTLSANGGTTPYEYTKNGGAGQSSPTFSALAAGTYTFAVKDAKMCTNTVSVTITEPTAITVTPTVTNVTCNGANNGQVVVVASGGASPYEYKFGTGGFQGLSTFTNLAPGTYTTVIKDANGCTASSDVTITEPAAVTVAFTSPVLSVLQGTAQTYTLSNTYTSYTWGAVPSGATVTAGGTSATNTVTYNFGTQGVKPVSVTVTDAAGCTASTTISVDVVPFVLISPKAKLQGSYSSATGLMGDKLRTLNLIPAAQPYTLTQVNNAGTETVAPAVLAVTGNDAIVDWVFLQLRSAADPSVVVSTRSALIQRDGDIVDVDGVSPVKMVVPIGTLDFYVTVKHRNHLGVMTAATVTTNSATTTFVDFTSPATATYTNGSNTAQLGSTTKLMRAGNANGNNNIKAQGTTNDVTAVLVKVGTTTPTNIVSGYFREDVNMDGLVKYEGTSNDQTVINVAVGSTTLTNIIIEQTPN